MINNARELVNAEGFGTLEYMGRKYNNHSPFTVWIGLRPINESHRPIWHDEPEAKNEDILDLSWESVEVIAATINNETERLDGEETERIVLTFPFEYCKFLDAVTQVIHMASKL
jgi:hypothetical protein